MGFDLTALGHRVRGFRLARGMTSKSLAESSGVSLRFLSQLENGQGNISISRLASVAEALAVPLAILIDERLASASDAQRATLSSILDLSPVDFERVSEALREIHGHYSPRMSRRQLTLFVEFMEEMYGTPFCRQAGLPVGGAKLSLAS